MGGGEGLWSGCFARLGLLMFLSGRGRGRGGDRWRWIRERFTIERADSVGFLSFFSYGRGLGLKPPLCNSSDDDDHDWVDGCVSR